MTPRQLQITALLGGALLVSAALQGCKNSESAAPAVARLEVKAMRVAKSDVPISMEFVGQTKGSVDAEIRARVEGVVTGMRFEEGRDVEEGQLLYTIDPAPYQAKVAEAQGKLAEARTALVKAQSDLGRIRPLVRMKAMSERDLDRAVAQEGAAQGAVDAAVASLESAKIELGYCEIHSPTKGLIGHTKAKVGEFVGRAPNPIVLNTVSNLEPIHVTFAVSEKDYLNFARMQKQADGAKGREKRRLRMVLADGSVYPEQGEVASVGRAIDPATGTIRIEAAFPNPDRLIRPGQFAKIQTIAETVSGAIVIPKKALRELQGQHQVVVVKKDSTAEPRNVTLGSAVGEQQIVESGLSEDEVIVTDGLQRLKTGMQVTAKLEE